MTRKSTLRKALVKATLNDSFDKLVRYAQGIEVLQEADEKLLDKAFKGFHDYYDTLVRCMVKDLHEMYEHYLMECEEQHKTPATLNELAYEKLKLVAESIEAIAKDSGNYERIVNEYCTSDDYATIFPFLGLLAIKCSNSYNVVALALK